MQLDRRALLSGALALTCTGHGATARRQEATAPGVLWNSVRSLFHAAVTETRTVGAQLSIIREGQQLDFAAGCANVELDLEMTTETAVQVGSTTKLMNAAIIMSLVDEGRLSLDTPVRRYIPGFRVADPGASRSISLRQLLSMSSGLDNGPYTDFGPGSDSLGRYVRSLATLPQMFVAGRGFGYSNAGTSIAGYAAEQVTRKTWDALLMERILGPLELSHAASLEQELLFQRLAVGHTPDRAVIRPWAITRSQGPAGATFASSARDLAIFGELFLRRGVARSGKRVLSENACVQMLTPQVDTPTERYGDWCLGPARASWDGVELWGHAGGNRSGSSYLYWIPEKQGVIAFTTNTPAGFFPLTERIFTSIAAAAFGIRRPALVPTGPLPATGSLSRYVGVYSGSGLHIVIAGAGDALQMERRESNRADAVTERFAMTPLGGDRFLLEDGVARDIAFFGDDGSGRAANLIAPLVALRRVGRTARP